MDRGGDTAKLADPEAAMSDTSLPLDENLWALIASDLSVHDLGRLACVESWFSLSSNAGGGGGAISEEQWTVVEEGARLALERRFVDAPHTRAWIPRCPGESWCKLLRELDQLHKFDQVRIDRGLELDEIFGGETDAVFDGNVDTSLRGLFQRWELSYSFDRAFGEGGCNCGDCPCCVRAGHYMMCVDGYCGSCHQSLPCQCNVNEIQFGCLGLSPPHDAQL